MDATSNAGTCVEGGGFWAKAATDAVATSTTSAVRFTRRLYDARCFADDEKARRYDCPERSAMKRAASAVHPV